MSKYIELILYQEVERENKESIEVKVKLYIN